RGLDNDVGIPTEDFMCKPVRHSELLDWLALRLALTWLESAPAPVAPVTPSPRPAWVYPQRPYLDALREVVSLGYYRGILNKLDEIEKLQPQCAAFVGEMRSLARQFKFEAMGQQLTGEVHES
ncbi:MAG: hybrid sensor histidine kinase/response regulator, partial [Rhodoferax sp.]|nr:hybrid sensor histidine kinase/response regulator [Rhodoferax sp.]